MSAVPAFAGSWSSLPTPLTDWVYFDVIQSMGHTQMTPDVVVEAVTGSGKTLAFVIPVLERIIRRENKLKHNEMGALIISPTRELASQIHSVFTSFLSSQPDPDFSQTSSGHRLTPALLLVSSSQSSTAQDVERFLTQGSDIVIGTPGRVEEFLGRASVNARELDVLILDEADRLLDLGFQQSLTRILSRLPKQRRTGLFSATMTDADAMSELVRAGLRNPVRIVVKVQSKQPRAADSRLVESGGVLNERRIPSGLKIFGLVCHASEKLIQLVRIILHENRQHHSIRFILYFATGASVDYFYKILPLFLPEGVQLFSLHGRLTPLARTRTLTSFTNSSSTSVAPSLLLATDVAARGLDIPDVDAIVQFDPPTDSKAFSHRCGRTARAGRRGRAWVLLTGREHQYIDFLAVRKIPVTRRERLIEDGVAISSSDELEAQTISTYLAIIRKYLLRDRTLHDMATKAFVSFIRAYSKHEASYIFRLKSLDLSGVAESYGLLRLPRMPELKDVETSSWHDADIKEMKRLNSKAQQTHRSKPSTNNKDHIPWSKQLAKKDAKERRRVKKRGERDDSIESEDDWASLAEEERLAKKLKNGKISQAEFDTATFSGL
ncbi:P-loop containing nucleoside triphosphate hydrolase protein [Lactarius quietus]|nr:P-loop containing nucleoside triphosphate hydrolase protein [Lactarius quietus]